METYICSFCPINIRFCCPGGYSQISMIGMLGVLFWVLNFDFSYFFGVSLNDTYLFGFGKHGCTFGTFLGLKFGKFGVQYLFLSMTRTFLGSEKSGCTFGTFGSEICGEIKGSVLFWVCRKCAAPSIPIIDICEYPLPPVLYRYVTYIYKSYVIFVTFDNFYKSILADII